MTISMVHGIPLNTQTQSHEDNPDIKMTFSESQPSGNFLRVTTQASTNHVPQCPILASSSCCLTPATTWWKPKQVTTQNG